MWIHCHTITIAIKFLLCFRHEEAASRNSSRICRDCAWTGEDSKYACCSAQNKQGLSAGGKMIETDLEVKVIKINASIAICNRSRGQDYSERYIGRVINYDKSQGQCYEEQG